MLLAIFIKYHVYESHIYLSKSILNGFAGTTTAVALVTIMTLTLDFTARQQQENGKIYLA